MCDIEDRVVMHIKHFIKNSLDISTIDKNLDEHLSDIGRTSALYYYYKKEKDNEKAEEILQHLKAQIASLDAMKAIENAEQREKLLIEASYIIFKIVTELLLR